MKISALKFCSYTFTRAMVCILLSQLSAPSFALPKQKLPTEILNTGFREPWRFAVVVVMGTWNPESKGLLQKLQDASTKMKGRGIRFSVTFSHDKEEDVRIYCKNFTVECGTSPQSLIDKLNNPPVPTLWIIDQKFRVLKEQNLPNNKMFDDEIKNLGRWTDF